MQIQENFSLRGYNTFGIEASAELFVRVSSVEELREVLAHSSFANMEKRILGGGSNILLTHNLKGLVIQNEIRGIEIAEEDENSWIVKAGAGEIWHEFVLHCIEHGYAGVENLSLIPGRVGAAPMQNIGAYGIELKDVFHSLQAVDIASGEIVRFNKEECKFGYRASSFKHELKGRYVIVSVSFRLLKKPQFHVNYGSLSQQLETMGVSTLSLQAVSNAVIAIRSSKLPDPAKIGNAGSFFKNPVIGNEAVKKLQKNYPDVVTYPAEDGLTKVAAGWLIDKAGWKGKVIGSYGIHKNQALVLVNYGGAKGKDIYQLAQDVKQDIASKFDIKLEEEVNIW